MPIHPDAKHVAGPSNSPTTDVVPLLTSALDQILRAYPGGISEHALLKVLQSPEWNILGPVNFRDPAALYPVHFLVFHGLYRLRDMLYETGDETLVISALRIAIVPARGARAGLPGHRDKLAEFYSEIANLRLESTVINEMLDDFWRGVRRPPESELRQACEVLELQCPPPGADAANLQFRRLAMAHHPDRGGQPGRLQSINHAIAVVRSYLRHTA